MAIGYGIALQCATAMAGEAYKLLTEIPIGGEGGWDILTVDPATRRLYLSHATKVVVVDIDANKVAGEVAELENKSSVVDLQTLNTTSKVETGDGPDAIAYDGKRGELYVFNHKGHSATVFGAKAANVVTTIPLDGSPEFAVADEAAGRVYCNIEDKSEVAVIDAPKHEVIAQWPLTPGEEPTGIALDARHHRLFATCKKVMVMLDTDSGNVAATVPIGTGADGCTFDEARQLAFASCGEGVTTIAREESPDRLTVVENLKTEPGARTIALDPKTHRIFLPTAQFQPPPSPLPGASPPRPTIVPDTLKLLVYGPAELATQ